MVVSNFAERFFDMPIADFETGGKPKPGHVHRLMQEYEADQSQRELLDEYFGKVDKTQLQALVIGAWGDAATGTPPQEFLDGLIAHKLPQFRALFCGDMPMESAEISWINQANYEKFLAAYPNIEALRIRGGNFGLPVMKLPKLRELAIETGGLPHEIVDSIAASDLPSLVHLELWLGDDNYGYTGDLSHFVKLLEKIRPERLSYLGLRNAQISDDIAKYLAKQPWLARLPMLDLSMGTIGDEGAEALLASPYIKGLGALNLRHHYISDGVLAKLKKLSLVLNVEDQEEADEGERYVEVGE